MAVVHIYMYINICLSVGQSVRRSPCEYAALNSVTEAVTSITGQSHNETDKLRKADRPISKIV